MNSKPESQNANGKLHGKSHAVDSLKNAIMWAYKAHLHIFTPPPALESSVKMEVRLQFFAGSL
jgi:hypothetical protein